MRLPLGDQAGVPSLRVPLVTCRRWLPSAFITQMYVLVRPDRHPPPAPVASGYGRSLRPCLGNDHRAPTASDVPSIPLSAAVQHDVPEHGRVDEVELVPQLDRVARMEVVRP
jgi:hypothetical protein